MKKIIGLTFILIAVISLNACKKDKEKEQPGPAFDKSLGYFPMQIGNFWKIGDHYLSEIKEKETIEGKEYYHFEGFVGGDVSVNEYYRLDDQNNLFQGFNYPNALTSEYLIASFNKKKGDVFYVTTIPSTPDNLKITVVEKTDDVMVFYHEYPIHSSVASRTITFKKGLGISDNYSEVKINNVVYKF